jgi:hypothetical protein
MIRFALLAAIAFSCSANDDIPAPLISSVTPNHAPPGATVTVSGSYFCQQPTTEDPLACANMGVVEFGVTSATTSQYTDTAIMVEVPNALGNVDITVNTGGRVSNTADFTID